jgi:hypothetical protein
LPLPDGDLLAILAARAAAIDLGLGAPAMDLDLGAAAFTAAAAAAGTDRRLPAHLAGSFTAESDREEQWARTLEREIELPLTSEGGGVGIHGCSCCARVQRRGMGGARLMVESSGGRRGDGGVVVRKVEVGEWGVAVGVVGFEIF